MCREKICFVGEFDRSSLKDFTCRNDVEVTFSKEKTSEFYDFVIVKNDDIKSIEFWQDSYFCTTVKVDKGSAEDCSTALLNFCYNGYMSGLDMTDVCACIHTRKCEALFYGELSFDEVMRCFKRFDSYNSILIKIHIPVSQINTEELEIAVQKMRGCFDDETAFLWNADFIVGAKGITYDLFLAK